MEGLKEGVCRDCHCGRTIFACRETLSRRDDLDGPKG